MYGILTTAQTEPTKKRMNGIRINWGIWGKGSSEERTYERGGKWNTNKGWERTLGGSMERLKNKSRKKPTEERKNGGKKKQRK